jgi:hypothetical protein
MKLKLEWTLDDEHQGFFERPGGEIPIMVRVGIFLTVVFFG